MTLGDPGQAGCKEVVQQGPSATGCFPGVVETLKATLDNATHAGAGQVAGRDGVVDTLTYFITTLTTPMVVSVDITIGWLDCFFPTIRKKLSLSLSYWHPTDRSAKLILLPWQEVFSCDLMCAFLTNSIVQE